MNTRSAHDPAKEIAALEQAGASARIYRLRRGRRHRGEESAMIESIEAWLAASQPPFVAQVVFGRPTLVHNVETLLWVARICRGGPAFQRSSTMAARAAQLFRLGRVAAPGVPARRLHDHRYHRSSWRHVGGPSFKAYQPGGPSSGILPASLNDVLLDFDTCSPTVLLSAPPPLWCIRTPRGMPRLTCCASSKMKAVANAPRAAKRS